MQPTPTIICRRRLSLAEAGDGASVDIVFFATETAPERYGPGFVCRFEVRWPDRVKTSFGLGIDEVDAIQMAFVIAGTRLHTSPEHAEGRLSWLEEGFGYGFPVPPTLRDMLRGHDKERFG